MLTTKKQNIVLAMHKNPDGDACGAAGAIKLVLEKKYPEKNVYIFSNSSTTKFRYTYNFEEVKFTSYDELPEDNELYILDHFDQDYSLVPDGEAEKFTSGKVIDHHQLITRQEKKKQLFVNTSAGSTCEIIFDYMQEHAEELITPEVAAALFLGIKSDSCYMTVDTRIKVLDMLHLLVDKYKARSIIEEKGITGFSGYLSFGKGLVKVIARMTMTQDIVTLRLYYHDYIKVTEQNHISCGRILTFLLSMFRVRHAILAYEFKPQIGNVSLRTKRKGVINRLEKILNKQFLEYGFTLVGIIGEDQTTAHINLIKATIKSFSKDFPN